MKKLLIILALLLPAATQADWYLVITKDFAEQHKTMCILPNCFGYNVAVINGDSFWVCATNSLREFRDTFALYQFDSTDQITPEDFPQPVEDSSGN